jgi:hypothetical protein
MTGQPYPGGIDYPLGPTERFQAIPSSLPRLGLAHPNLNIKVGQAGLSKSTREAERCTGVTNAVVGEADGASCWRSLTPPLMGWKAELVRLGWAETVGTDDQVRKEELSDDGCGLCEAVSVQKRRRAGPWVKAQLYRHNLPNLAGLVAVYLTVC